MSTADDDFDPASIGAVPVEDEPEFDPRSIGAVLVEDDADFDPRSIGAVPVEEAASLPGQSGDAVAKPGFSFNGKVALDAFLSPWNDGIAATEAYLPNTPEREAARREGRLGTQEQADAQMEKSKEAMQTPILTLPRSTAQTVPAGVGRGLTTVAESLTTGENLVLLASIGGAPRAIQKAAAAGFGAMMAKEIPGQIEAIKEAKTPSEMAERITETAATAAMTVAAAKHAGGRSPIKAAERAASMEQAKAVVEAQKESAPLTAQAVAEAMPTNSAAPTPSPEAVKAQKSIQRAKDAREMLVDDLKVAEESKKSAFTKDEKASVGRDIARINRRIADKDALIAEREATAAEASRATEQVADTPAPGEAARPTPPTVEKTPALAEGAAAAAPESRPSPKEETFTAWHGTSESKPIENFDLGKIGSNPDVLDAKLGFFFGRDPNGVTSTRATGAVGKYEVNLKNPYRTEQGLAYDMMRLEFKGKTAPEIREELIARGHDGIVTPNKGEIVAFFPESIKRAPKKTKEQLMSEAADQWRIENTDPPISNAGADPVQPLDTPTPGRAPAPLRPVELLPEQAEVAAPKLDVRRSPFALGVSPDLKAVNWLTANTKRLFTATGDLPKQTFERWIERNGFVKAESRQTAYATRDLYNALKKEFNISTTEQLTKGFEKVPRDFVGKMNQALLGEVDINTLPESVRAPLQAMRQHIDALSQKMLDEGVIPESLQAKVADNLGIYMTRSYRIFDDPKWAESIPQDVRNRARDFILSNLKKENPSAGPVEAKAVMDAMLQDWKDQGSGALVKTGGKVGSKDLTSLIARKDIPKVIREVMGEYQDPLISYTRSITKAANLLGSHRFLNQVRGEGLGKFLFEDGKQPSTHSALIAAEGSDVMAPLNGLRTTPEIATAFREFGKSDPIKNGIAQAYFTLSGIAKMSKTVGSVMTQARNIIGQTYFFLANGHFDMTKAAPAVRAIMADLGARDTPAGREAYQRYLRLGIVDQSAKASELRDVIRDAGLSDPGANLTEPGKVLLRTTKKLTLDAATKAYQISDDLGKIIGFENELTRQREIHPEWSQTTLEAAAAERIRNTYPTYAMASKAIQTARRAPLGPFMIFASESFRTAYHNLRYAIEDVQSSNPAQRKAGAQRIAGLMAVAGSGYALSKISQALIGMNAQDEDDARRFMAPWDKDSQIMYTGKDDNGAARFINLSYANPYSYMTDPVMAVAGGLRSEEELQAIMLRSLGKLAQPFTSEDIIAGSLISLARNKTPTGARVFNPGDTPGKQFEDKLAFMAKTFEPGTLTRVKGKIIPAIKGETDKTGRVPELTNEIVSELTGFKSQILDFQQAVGFKARAFKAMDDDADSIFRDVAGRRGTVQPDEIVDAYSRAARSKFAAWKEMHGDIQAAERRGVSRDAIQTALKARGVSQKETSAIMAGKFIPPQVSPALQKQMRDAKRTMPPAAEQEMRRAAGLVLSGSFE